jgi:AGCS family alanine or glycine:cation symporter
MDVITKLNGLLWGPWTLYGLLLAGIVFTIWTKFSQRTVLTHGVAVTRGKFDDPSDPGAINHFQALSAALSATIGLGNIGGVAIAISIGGPGALFWMWVVGFLGMALKTVEITMAMMYRDTSDPDDPHGGAMWVIDRTLGQRGGVAKIFARFAGSLFCITMLIMTMAGGNMFQTWNVADLTLNYFGVPKVATGIILAVVVGLVIIGGIKRIGRVAGRIVPLMCVLYLTAGLAVLAINIQHLPGILLLVVKSAFSPVEATGAFVGASAWLAFTWGLKRALFSNEAGLGSAPIAHSAAKTNEPAREGVVGGMGPFIDTICICTLTALVILSTGAWNRGPTGELAGELQLITDNGQTSFVAPTSTDALPELPPSDSWSVGSTLFVVVDVPNPEGEGRVHKELMGRVEGDELGRPTTIAWDEAPAGADWILGADGLPQKGVYKNYVGASLTSHAFDRAFPGLGKWLVTLASWLFAISTMISWSYYGEQGMIYLGGKRTVLPYKLVFLLLAIVGSVFVETTRELGDMSDLGAGLMLWANMIIVVIVGGAAVRCLDDYTKRLKAGEFRFHAAKSVEEMVSGRDQE